MPKKRIVFYADGVNHVRDIPDGRSLEDEMQDYFLKRAGKPPAEKGPKEPKIIDPPKFGEVEAETAETIGPGTCPSCGKEFKRLDMHVCKSVDSEELADSIFSEFDNEEE